MPSPPIPPVVGSLCSPTQGHWVKQIKIQITTAAEELQESPPIVGSLCSPTQGHWVKGIKEPFLFKKESVGDTHTARGGSNIRTLGFGGAGPCQSRTNSHHSVLFFPGYVSLAFLCRFAGWFCGAALPDPAPPYFPLTSPYPPVSISGPPFFKPKTRPRDFKKGAQTKWK